jgi:mandelamide amidase
MNDGRRIDEASSVKQRDPEPRARTSRRRLLGAGALLAAWPALACTRAEAGSDAGTGTGNHDGRGRSAMTAGDSERLGELTAVEAVRAMRQGELTAEAYAGALLDRCARWQHLNAFIALVPSQVLEAARAADRLRASGAPLGTLHGLPIPVKDSVNTKDYPTTAGTNALRAFRPAEDAAAVAQLRAAGAIVLGKTNLHELSFGWTSDNQAFGAVRNPYDPARIPGGSTGGTAAAIAARMAPLGIAEDTQGSIRVPAALCGICGFRPTMGRYSTAGAAPITPVFDQVGPHARSVDDLALFDAVLTGDARPLPNAALAGVRLGIPRAQYLDGVDAEVAAVTAAVLERLREAGVVFVEVDLPEVPGLVGRITGPLQLHDVLPSLARYLRESGAPVDLAGLLAQVSPDVLGVLARFSVEGAPEAVPETVYAAARDVHRPALQRLFADCFARHGIAALVFPTTMVPATPIGAAETVMIDGVAVPFMTAIARNIAPGSTAGLPGLVLPGGLTPRTRLPVGIELDGPAGSDRALLALGRAITAVLAPMPAPSLMRPS